MTTCLTIWLVVQTCNQHRALLHGSSQPISRARRNSTKKGFTFLLKMHSVALLLKLCNCNAELMAPRRCRLSWALSHQICVINKKLLSIVTSDSPVRQRKKCTQGCLRRRIFARGINEINYLTKHASRNREEPFAQSKSSAVRVLELLEIPRVLPLCPSW